MKLEPISAVLVSIWRHAWARRARRICLAVVLLLCLFSAGLRVRTFILTRRIHAVLAGMWQVRVDATTEQQLLSAVPFLVRDPNARGFYRVQISNEEDTRWLGWVLYALYRIWPHSGGTELPVQNTWQALDVPGKAAYALGWRHLSFVASATVLHGIVSGTSYEIEPDVFLGWPASYLVVARSAHGFWKARSLPVPVSSAHDESPEFRFGSVAGQFSMIGSPDGSIGVAYTPDAPPELISHVFQVDLSCFWGPRGCSSVRQVTPLLWNDQQRILAAASSRLRSQDPCPDRILAERVRTLPDLNIALLEVVNTKREAVNDEGDHSEDFVTEYRLKEVIRGRADGPWTHVRRRPTIPSPLPGEGMIANTVPPVLPNPGDRFLFFSGAHFDSCRIVPATPSAESAVRTAVLAPKKPEDDVSRMEGRM